MEEGCFLVIGRVCDGLGGGLVDLGVEGFGGDCSGLYLGFFIFL